MSGMIRLKFFLPLFPCSAAIVWMIRGRYEFAATAVVLGLSLAVSVFAILRSRTSRRCDWFLVTAYLCCLGGDWLLACRGGSELWFLAGSAMFGLVHLNLLCLMLCNGRIRKRVLAVLSVLLLTYFAFFLLPLDGVGLPLKLMALVYLQLSGLTLSAAAGLRLAIPVKVLFIGAVSLLAVSDLTISFKEFLHWEKLNVLLMPAYWFFLVFMCAGMCLKQSGGNEAKKS